MSDRMVDFLLRTAVETIMAFCWYRIGYIRGVKLGIRYAVKRMLNEAKGGAADGQRDQTER